VRLTSEVYVVGGGANLCFGLSDDPDCHVYLLDGGDEYALIDCGMAAGRSLDRIAENILREGLHLTRLRTLILTHYHMTTPVARRRCGSASGSRSGRRGAL
jgi:glyoxylase-like metal-dependent hydrolase (beta-lactamase superfamily II)